MNHTTRVEALPMPEPAACRAHWQGGQAQRGPAVAICTYTARQGAPLESTSHRCQVKVFSPTLRLCIPSPLVGEGQGEGANGTTSTVRPLFLTFPRKEGRNPSAHRRGIFALKLTPIPYVAAREKGIT